MKTIDTSGRIVLFTFIKSLILVLPGKEHRISYMIGHDIKLTEYLVNSF